MENIKLLNFREFLQTYFSDELEPLNIDGVISTILAGVGWVFQVLLVRTAINTHFLQLEFASSGCSIIFAVPITSMINYFLHSDILGNFDMWSFDFYSFSVRIDTNKSTIH